MLTQLAQYFLIYEYFFKTLNHTWKLKVNLDPDVTIPESYYNPNILDDLTFQHTSTQVKLMDWSSIPSSISL